MGIWPIRALTANGSGVLFWNETAFEEVLVKQLFVNAPSFSREDEMPVVGRKYHMAAYGTFRLDADGNGIIDPESV